MTPRERWSETELTAEVERELRALDEALAGLPVDPEHQSVADFARELRAERPEPSADFAEELDEHAAAGFPGGASWLRRVRDRLGDVAAWRPTVSRSMRQSMAWGGALATVLIALVVVVSVVQIGGGGGGSSDDDAATGGEFTAESLDEDGAGEPVPFSAEDAAPQAEGGDVGDLGFTPEPGAETADDSRNRAVEREAQLELSTAPESVRRVADEAIEVVEANSGIILSSEIRDNRDATSRALLDISVPAENLNATLARLSDLAMVESRRDASLDVTAQFRSTRERLKDLRAERDGVRNRLANATTEAEADELGRDLRQLNRRIAVLRAEKEQLDNRIERAPIALTISGNGTDDTAQGTIGAAADDAVDVLRFLAGIGIVAAAVIVPLAALALIVWLIRRRLVDRRRERALDA